MEKYTTHIKAKTGWFDIDFKELWQYRDLILLFVKRNYSTRYKQTILGPLWLILKPLFTVGLYVFVFGNMAGMPMDGASPFAFYLCSNAIWSYFSLCITDTSQTFTANAGIMGKVYFPRLVMPISSVITGLIDLFIQLCMLAVVIVYEIYITDQVVLGMSILLMPLVIFQASLLGLGCGIIVAACTTKYRDLAVVVTFGVQLWMYASPVLYSGSGMFGNMYTVFMCNPMAPILTVWRYSILGTGELPLLFWGISWITTIIVLALGVILFSRIEKTFMDTV